MPAVGRTPGGRTVPPQDGRSERSRPSSRHGRRGWGERDSQSWVAPTREGNGSRRESQTLLGGLESGDRRVEELAVATGYPKLTRLLEVLHCPSRLTRLEQRLSQMLMHEVEKPMFLALDSAVIEQTLEVRRGFARLTAQSHHISEADTRDESLPVLADVVGESDGAPKQALRTVEIAQDARVAAGECQQPNTRRQILFDAGLLLQPRYGLTHLIRGMSDGPTTRGHRVRHVERDVGHIAPVPA